MPDDTTRSAPADVQAGGSTTATHAGDPAQAGTVVQVGVPDAVREAAGFPPVPGYELSGEIGAGGMGVVYRARDLALNRDVAIKLLQPRFAPGDAAARRFLEEAQITGQLQHPGIPPVHQVGTLPNGHPFLAMKLIKGRTLHALLKERADPAENRARLVAVFEQVCLAVGYAHSRGVVHRDLKPSNVMVGAFGEVQVMDWGLAKVVGAAWPRPDAPPPGTSIRRVRELGGETQAGSVLGSPAYMPPEQAGGEVAKIDPRADVFGLGAVLCVILTGAPPYIGADGNEIHLKAIRGETQEAFARLDACGAEPELVALCKRCLAADPERRPGDGGSVAAAVASFRADAERRARQAELDRVRAEANLEAARAKVVEQRKRRRVQTALLASVALLVIAGGAFAWREDRRATAAKTEEERRQNAERADEERRKAKTEREVTVALAEMDTLCDRGGQEIDNPPRLRLTLAAARSAHRRASAALDAGLASAELRATLAAATDRLKGDEFDCETAELCEKWFIDLVRSTNRKTTDGDFTTLHRRLDGLYARLGVDLATAPPDAVVSAVERSRLRYHLTPPLLVGALVFGEEWRRTRKATADRLAERAHPLQSAALVAERKGSIGDFLRNEGKSLTSSELVCVAVAGRGRPGGFASERAEREVFDEAIRRNPANLVALTFRLGKTARSTPPATPGPPGTHVEFVPIEVPPPRPRDWPPVSLVPLPEEQVRAIAAVANAVAVRPDLPALWSWAGELMAGYRLYGMAAERFRQALMLDPSRVDDQIDFAAALVNAGRMAEAVEQYRLIFSKFPELATGRPELFRAAARAAAFLAGEHEEGKRLGAEQKRELRLAALGWLRKWVRAGPHTGRDAAIARHDPALRSVRDSRYLDALPAEEVARWVALWDDLRGMKTTGHQRFAVQPLTATGRYQTLREVAPAPREVNRK